MIICLLPGLIYFLSFVVVSPHLSGRKKDSGKSNEVGMTNMYSVCMCMPCIPRYPLRG